MFKDFANLWTIAGLARAVGPTTLLPMTIAGERVVVFRDSNARLAALIDRCPHRGVALSLGKVREGILECPFHGWRFDGTGANCHVPWNPDAKRQLLGATALPVREAGGLIWLHTGAKPSNEPDPPESLALPGLVICVQSVVWNAHWTRVMENMLDSPHLPFVHARTIGRGLRGLADRRMDLSWHPENYGARILHQVEGRERISRLDYRYPNAMELFIDPPGRKLRLMAVCLPEAPGRTRLDLYTVRDFARWPVLDPVFRRLNARIASEDRVVLESSWPAEVPPPGEERSVRTDGPTLAFRKLYFERIRGTES